MPMLSPNQKPAIHLYILGPVEQSCLSQLGFGMEEEGIPFDCLNHHADSSVSLLDLAHQASQASPLSVGLAMDREGIYLHYRNLKTEDFLYYFRNYSKESKEVLRILGANAARLVKGSPLMSHERLETAF